MSFRTPPSMKLGLILTALVVIGTLYLLWFRPGDSRADIRKFTGNIVSIGPEGITLHGAFYPIPEPVPEAFRSERNFTFRIASSTRYFGISFSRPSPEEIQANGGKYRLKLSELPRKEGPGSLEELKQMAGTGRVFVEVSFSSSILSGEKPIAEQVVYRHLPTPDFE